MNTLKQIEDPMVDILLSTYEGASYLEELLDSILDQTYSNWKLLVRDDGSCDSTVAILKKYKAQHPFRFEILECGQENIGFTKSFLWLVERSRAEYVAFCDQDDVWLPDKLSVQISQMIVSEDWHGKQRPILVHSDLQVHNKDMGLIANSFWGFQNLTPNRMKEIRCLLVHNFITGCTMVINRALINIAIPFPHSIGIYDWWIALIALEQGLILTIDQPLVKYRQHGGNTIGARKWKGTDLFRQIAGWRGQFWQSRQNAIFQAKELFRYANADDRDIIYNFSRMDKKKWIERKILYIRIGIKKYGWLRQIATWLFI